MAEDQRAVAFLDHVLQLLKEHIEFRRANTGLAFVHQRDVKAELAQQCQGLEDGEPVLVHVI